MTLLVPGDLFILTLAFVAAIFVIVFSVYRQR